MPKAETSYEIKAILSPWEAQALDERVGLCRRSKGDSRPVDRAQVVRVAILDYLRSRAPDLELSEKEKKHRVALMMARGL